MNQRVLAKLQEKDEKKKRNQIEIECKYNVIMRAHSAHTLCVDEFLVNVNRKFQRRISYIETSIGPRPAGRVRSKQKIVHLETKSPPKRLLCTPKHLHIVL